GPQGRVLGVDISEPMLAVARGKAEAAGAGAVQFLEADAQVCAFDSGAADAACCGFGVMFFADPVAAFANVRRALKRGGRIAFLCWRGMQENPWMTIPLSAGLKHFPPRPPPEPDAPGPFAFAEGERVRGLLTAAGFSDVAVQAHDQKIGNDPAASLRMALRVGPRAAWTHLDAKIESTAAAAGESDLAVREAQYEKFVWDNLRRNYLGNYLHGMLGMTGFRLVNAPTFLPAYLHMISGSNAIVGLG